MKINKINLRHLRNDTHFQFHTEFKDLVQKHNPQDLEGKYAPHVEVGLGPWLAELKARNLAMQAGRVSKRKGKNSTAGGSHEER